MRSKYWSNGKFADWLRGTPSLECGSSKEWREWRTLAKTKHPIRYWIVEELLDKIQDCFMWPIDKLYAIKYYLANRYVTRTHALTSNLKRGQWHEFEERMIHCLFDELVEFVEVELAWKNIICDKEAAKKYRAPWTATGWFRTRSWRSPEAGLDHLRWEQTLVMDESWGLTKDDAYYGQRAAQALKADEIIELYNWWLYKRPNRPDPYDASGWSDICRIGRESSEDALDWLDRAETAEEREIRDRSIRQSDEIERAYDAEDEQMLIRLIKIRNSLWT